MFILFHFRANVISLRCQQRHGANIVTADANRNRIRNTVMNIKSANVVRRCNHVTEKSFQFGSRTRAENGGTGASAAAASGNMLLPS